MNNNIEKYPLIATLAVGNNEDTVYQSLLRSSKIFDAVLVVLDGSTDKSMLEIDRFIRRENPKNVHIFDLTSSDPWPQIKENYDFLDYARTQSKCLSLAKSLIKDGIWISFYADILIDENARSLILSKVKNWSNPDLNHEVFLTESIVDKNNKLQHKSIVSVMPLSSKLFIGPETYKTGFSLYLVNQGNLLMTMLDRDQTFSSIGSKIKDGS